MQETTNIEMVSANLAKVKRSEKTTTLPAPDFQAADKTGTTRKAFDKYTYFQLFRYSTISERVFVSVAVMFACLASSFVSFHVVIYGEYTSLLIDRTVGVGTSTQTVLLPLFGGGRKLTSATKEENMAAVFEDSVAFGVGSIVGAVLLMLLIAVAVDIQNRVALKQITRIRKLFLKAMLRQDMSWYDTSSGTDFASKMTEDLDKMKEGMGDKLGIFTFLIMTFVIGVVFSFFYGWELTLVVITCCPVIIISTAMVAKIQTSLTEKELQAYSDAGAVAEEVFGGIRTVFAFSGEHKESERFSRLLAPAERTGRKKGLYSGIGSGTMWFVIFCVYAIAMWYGVKLILADRDAEVRHYTPAVLVIVLFGIIMGAQNLGFSSPHVEAFATAKAAAQNIFSIIDRKSEIDSLAECGDKPMAVSGEIRFEGVHFLYPARPDIAILQGLTFDVTPGQTVAFVGASGCGKSTTLQLLQRFYDPAAGSVKLDGRDLRTLNVSWLRSQIGVVGQEPVLFATTIGENIRYGYTKATQEDIERAAKMANCHDFIVKLPGGYDTMVGEKGSQMSGGQKQRIAIARALVRNPKVLLLDEATSALDPTSEKRVQDALNVASQGRTTLVVSHRLSAVTNADKIIFVKEGNVAEQGTHNELMAMGGLYRQMVEITKRKEAKEKAESKYGGSSSTLIEGNARAQSDSSSEESGYDNPIEHSVEDLQGVQEPTRKKKSQRRRQKQKQKQEEKHKISFVQLMKLNAPEWRYILVGSVASMLLGATFPVWAVFFGDFFGIMQNDDNDYVQASANFFAYIFILIGVIAGLGSLTQTFMFNTAGVKMTSRLRKTAFKAIISQEVAYFDDEKNSVGALCARLASDCSNVQGATGVRIGIIIQSFSTMIVGLIIAFSYSWNLTLLTIITLPFIVLSICLEARFVEASAQAEKLAIEQASQVAVEAIANIRTVTSLGQEEDVLDRYSRKIDDVGVACRRKVRYRGLVFGFCQAAPFIAYGIALIYGGFLVANENLPYENIIKVSEALIFGSWMLGQALAYAPNVSAAILSAGRLLKLFQRQPKMHNPAENPYNTAEKSKGDITYDNVGFEYPTRKGAVLQNFNLAIEKGTTVALVGPSGSGKSTCVQLLLRYYDPTIGSVNLSGVATTEFPFDALRSKLGLVSQEPVLFDCTIADNIAYGNNFREDIPMVEIIEAAKKSNIHDFITSLSQGYDTRLGSKGAQLSGGQKQRIAIARALIRNPKILILDEATSALDLESEKIVQQALDVARSGRTCVTIAHRLTTVRDADLICVLKKGLIVEQGKHEELLALNGVYAELCMLQQVT